MRGRDLVHPLPLSAVVLLVVNDHFFKTSPWFPRALSGKLSDFAGLFFFPILLVSIARVAFAMRTRRAVWVASLSTALVFSAIKLEAHANAAAVWVLGSCALDPTDLVALPMTVLAALFLIRREHAGETNRWAQSAAILAASLASLATSPPYRPPCPAVPKGESHVSMDTLCARTKGAKVVTEGATVSITLDLTPNNPGCRLGARGLAVDQTVRPGLSARTIASSEAGVMDQMTRFQTRAELPYPARCDALRLGFLYENAIVDIPIVSCGAP
jgi:hypothetical protein